MNKSVLGLILFSQLLTNCNTTAGRSDTGSSVKDIEGPVRAPILIRKDDADIYNSFAERLKTAGFSWSSFCMNLVTYQLSSGARGLEIEMHKSKCYTAPMVAPHLTLVAFSPEKPFESWDGTNNVRWIHGLYLKGDESRKIVGYLGFDGRNNPLIGNLCAFSLAQNCDLIIDSTGAISEIKLK